METQPLIGNLEDLTNLLNEFAGDNIYQAKVKVWNFWYFSWFNWGTFRTCTDKLVLCLAICIG